MTSTIMNPTNTKTQAVDARFRCYVADLAAYNSGQLIGEWIDLDGLTAEEMQEAVSDVIKRSPFPEAEEYAIHDWDGLPSSFGEWPDWNVVANYVAAMEELEQVAEEAFKIYCQHLGELDNDDLISNFREAYRGCHESGEDYAQEYAEDVGFNADDAPWPFYYIDWSAAFRDLEVGGDIWSHRGHYGLHVFSNY
jgi:antirestriction protein